MSASSLAFELADKGLSLKVLDNTMLYELVRTSPGSGNMFYGLGKITEGLGSNPDPKMITDLLSSNISFENPEQHNCAQDSVIEILTKSVAKQLNFIKNQVVPAIDETIEDTYKVLDSYIGHDVSGSFNIIQVSLPKYLLSDEFGTVIEPYIKRQSVPFNISGKLRYGEPGILAPVLSKIVAELYSNRGNDIESFFTEVEAGLAYIDLATNGNDISSVNSVERTRRAFGLYLLANAMDSNKELSNSILKDNSDAAVTSFVREIYTFALPLITANLSFRLINDQLDATKIVVVDTYKQEKTAYVDSDNYAKFLEAGGKPEAIFGLLVSDKVDFTLNSLGGLLRNSDNLIAIFKKYVDLNSSFSQLELFNKFKMYFKQVFFEHMTKLTDVEKDFYQKNSAAMNTVRDLLDKELKALTIADVSSKETMYNTCYKIIAKTRFYFTQSYYILEAINKESKDGTEDPVTLATTATIYYLTDFFFSQVRLSK